MELDVCPTATQLVSPGQASAATPPMAATPGPEDQVCPKSDETNDGAEVSPGSGEPTAVQLVAPTQLTAATLEDPGGRATSEKVWPVSVVITPVTEALGSDIPAGFGPTATQVVGVGQVTARRAPSIPPFTALGLQVSPPLSLTATALPTATQNVGVAHATPPSPPSSGAGTASSLQVTPPSALDRATLAIPPTVSVRVPTATQLDKVGQTTASSRSEGSASSWVIQLLPPSVLVSDSPGPTATQSSGEGHETPVRTGVPIGRASSLQVAPESELREMAPSPEEPAPTARHMAGEVHATALNPPTRGTAPPGRLTDIGTLAVALLEAGVAPPRARQRETTTSIDRAPAARTPQSVRAARFELGRGSRRTPLSFTATPPPGLWRNPTTSSSTYKKLSY